MVKSQDTTCSHLFFNVNAVASLGILILCMIKSIMKSYEDVLAIIWIQFINVNKHVIFIAIHGWCQHMGRLPKSIFNIDTKVRLH